MSSATVSDNENILFCLSLCYFVKGVDDYVKYTLIIDKLSINAYRKLSIKKSMIDFEQTNSSSETLIAPSILMKHSMG